MATSGARIAAVVLLLACVGVGTVSSDTRDRSNVLTGGIHIYAVKPGDSIHSISARFGVAVATLVDDNRLAAARRLTTAQLLQVDNRHIVPSGISHGITINIPQRMLFVAGDDGVVRAFPVAVGRADWPSPTGEFTVTAKEIDPTWDVPASIQREQQRLGKPVLDRVPPGPANPLGDRWLGLSCFAVGIHGTNAPSSVFRFTTHGCFRLHPDDARTLFEMVEVGAPVRLVYQPVLAAVDEAGQLWLEVNPDVYKRAGNLERLARLSIDHLDPLAGATNQDEIKNCVRQRRGRPCRIG